MFHECLHPSTSTYTFPVLCSIIARKLDLLPHIHECVYELSRYCLLVNALNEVLTGRKEGSLGPFRVVQILMKRHRNIDVGIHHNNLIVADRFNQKDQLDACQ